VTVVEEENIKIDLNWNDDDVVPDNVTPDLIFLFDRMIEATIEAVDPAKGDLILDVGCGRAVDAIKIAKKGGRPVGIEPSLTMLGHCKNCVTDSGSYVALVQGIGEELPFRTSSFDWVVCKGALDHFPDPYKAISEMSRILKPGGKAVISIANFESLGHRLGRRVHYLTKLIPRKEPNKRQAWETPPDHTLRFDYPLIRQVVGSNLEIDEAYGICLFWGAPLWDRITSLMPQKMAFFIMNVLDRVARRIPGLSDVVLVKCSPKQVGP
jgi:SAM-dependent methyltransferase